MYKLNAKGVYYYKNSFTWLKKKEFVQFKQKLCKTVKCSI